MNEITANRCARTSQWGRPTGLVGWLVCRIMAAKNTGMGAAALSVLSPRNRERILEIGGGAGGTLAMLLDRVGPPGFVAGLDHSEVAARLSRRRNGAAIGAGRAEMRLGGVSDMPWPDASFDAVLAVNNFHFWPEPVSDMAQIRRVLRPGGRAVIGIRAADRPLRFEFAGADQGHTRADAALHAMQVAGFEDVRVERVPVGRLVLLAVVGRKPVPPC